MAAQSSAVPSAMAWKLARRPPVLSVVMGERYCSLPGGPPVR